MARKKPMLTDEIRQAIKVSGLSRYRIAKTLGIAESTLSRFMNGKAGFSLKTLDRLAKLLDLHLSMTRLRMKKG